MPTPVQAQLTLDTHTPQNVPEFPIHLHILCKHISAFPCAPPLAENFPMTRECTKQLQHHLQWQDGERTTSGLSDHTTKVLCHCKDHAAKGRPSWTDGPSLQWLLLAIKVGGKKRVICITQQLCKLQSNAYYWSHVRTLFFMSDFSHSPVELFLV